MAYITATFPFDTECGVQTLLTESISVEKVSKSKDIASDQEEEEEEPGECLFQ
jgi:hypothetical protein